MYTEKPTKNIITNETIARELWQNEKKSFFGGIGMVASLIIFGGAFLLLFYTLAIKNNDHLNFLPWFFFILIAVCFGLLLMIFGHMAILSLGEVKKIKRHEFAVITDTVSYKKVITLDSYEKNPFIRHGYAILPSTAEAEATARGTAFRIGKRKTDWQRWTSSAPFPFTTGRST